MKHSVIQYRGYDDFKFGSFSIYVTKNEVVIRGILKKNNSSSLYMMIRSEK